MKHSVAIVGGGASALIAAAFLDPKKFDVTIYEKNKSLGRKFLVAGEGGLNLTHSENINKMIDRYTPGGFLNNALLRFSNLDLCNWLSQVGVRTVIGSSKKIYPEDGMKAIDVLNRIKGALYLNNVHVEYGYKWEGWTENNELFFNGRKVIKADYVIFALGGASWKVTGSDGKWLNIFNNKKITTLPFLPANCAYEVNWPYDFIALNEGSPLKNLALECNGKTQKGELVITGFGLEGTAIYALSTEIQSLLSEQGKANVYLDLKPGLQQGEINKRIAVSTLKVTEILKRHIKLSKVQIHLLKAVLDKGSFLNPNTLSEKIKALPLTLVSAAPLDEAISTTGGIALSEVNGNFEFNKMPNNFCIGEMLDWNAPTGGYLLQASFSMGVAVARYLNSLWPETK